MKIAITTSGNDLNSPLDTRFGRAPKFLIYDLEAKTFEIADNEQNLNAAQGAGIQSAQNIARQGVKALVTGHCGRRLSVFFRLPASKSITPPRQLYRKRWDFTLQASLQNQRTPTWKGTGYEST
jgi:predicted Fe-Mo cluster-binding NifX family protein